MFVDKKLNFTQHGFFHSGLLEGMG